MRYFRLLKRCFLPFFIIIFLIVTYQYMTVLHTCSTLRAEHIPNNDERTEDERTAAILTQQHSSFTKKTLSLQI